MKHTPAPWRRLPDSGVITARNDEFTICDCDIDSDANADEYEANVLLISAAPDMYSALLEAQEIIRKETGATSFAIESALRKARGESE